MDSQISVQPFEEFLQARLQRHSTAMSMSVSDETLWYVGTMLSTFTDSKQLFVYENGRTLLPTLAFLYRDANDAISAREKINLLRKLGDTALFVGSLFSERFIKKGISKDYFVGMGGGAYACLAEHWSAESHTAQSDIYGELSGQFPRVMELVASVCAKELSFDAQDVLELYEHWHNSGCEIAKKKLIEMGITVDRPQTASH